MDDPDPPVHLFTVDEPDQGARPVLRSRLALAAIVLFAAAVGLVVVVANGQTDTALLFVGLPTLLALAVVASPPARSVHGMTFKGLTLGLLVTAVLLHEGAICVLLAAPLVYLCGHGVVALVDGNRRNALVVVPIALALSIEGVTPGLRIAPEQSVTVVRTVEIGVDAVAERVAAGPDLGTGRSWLLAGIPLPEHVTDRDPIEPVHKGSEHAAGQGADDGPAVGGSWTFEFHGDGHGPGGELITEVIDHTVIAGVETVRFRCRSDSSIVARWLTWTRADLSWQAVDDTRTVVTLTMRFTRGLDPSWYFGPLQDALVREGAGFLLDSLDLS